MGIFNTLLGRASRLQRHEARNLQACAAAQAASVEAALNLRNAALLAELNDVNARLRRADAEVGRLSAALVPAALHARNSAAFEQLSTCVLLTDTANCVVYINSALLNVLRQLEPAIRKELPGFSADELAGRPADPLQRKVVPQHDKPGHSTVMLGGRSFGLVATPVTGADGRQLGTVTEWRDRSDELALASQIEAALARASAGELEVRIDCRGRHGPLAMVAAHINTLLDGFTMVVLETGAAVAALAEGRLTRRIDADFSGSYGQLKTDINQTIDKLVQVVTDIRSSADSVKIGAREISSGNLNLSQRTEEQAASLEETSAAMEQITTTVQQNAANAVQANTLARGARESAENGGDVVGKAVAAMQAISESSNRINDIIGVIDEIAFQTNLLALNAAVEAARAGDQGRGFAVVADEVRNLAGRSATAAKEIKELIKDSSEKVREGSRLVNKSGATLGDIVTAVKKVNDIVAEISTASDEQATGLEEINRAVGEMDTMTQQNAALVEEAAAASDALGTQAQALETLTTFFDLGAAFVPALPPLVRAPVHSAAASRNATGSRNPAGNSSATGNCRAGADRRARTSALRAVKPAARNAAPRTASGRAPVRPLPKPLPARKPVYDNGDDKDWAEF